MPADARSEVLSAIRSANRDGTDLRRAELEYAEIPRDYTQHAALSRDETITQLTERLIDYNAHVFPCDADQLPSAIRDALQQHGAARVLVPEDFPRNMLPEGLAVSPDTNLTPAELDLFDAAVTLCTLAIAETGTLVLQGLAGQGRRAATLVPDLHVCVLRAEDVVNTVPEGFERLVSTARHPLTFVSGPSATADIEMTRIKGVHGPRQLHILLVNDFV
ncbi:MAG TPA: lactate utilization protein C [Acidobacteriaceae bacterium]|nr:lactate utilization protein C [Acidobacteriaceae bacterium]